MASYAWVLKIRPGYEEEYKLRHDTIWPEMTEALQQYTTALQIYLQYPDWLLRVKVPEALKPSARAGSSSRQMQSTAALSLRLVMPFPKNWDR